MSLRGVLATVSGLLLCLLYAANASAGGYSTPTSGQSPHGNYADTTTKCKVCHAVHNAAAADNLQGGSVEALLRSQRGQPTPVGSWDIYENGAACTYCHIVGAWSIKKVYGGALANYRGDSRYNHDDNHRWFHARQEYRGCMSCHSVHGANLLPGYEAAIVSRDPGGSLPASQTATLTDFCRDCHEDRRSGFQVWGFGCGTCHIDPVITPGGTHGPSDDTPWTQNYPPFFVESRNGTSHVMTTTLTGNYGTQVAWSDSSACRDCHMGGTHTEDNSFPHYTSGAHFLDDDYRPLDDWSTDSSGLDRVCLNCHAQGGDGTAYTTGVGKSF